ncbi:MAG: AbrB/MazE/SpoVT family DNA-binding domain-containing protein [bacterium]|nr:AbrB/MazE/SpoVT family DNA-binding domain-containing protein [bacterium]
MEPTAKLSSKYQIVIPKKIRRKLNLNSGDELIMKVEDDKIIMRPKPKSYTEYMLGLGKEVWETGKRK